MALRPSALLVDALETVFAFGALEARFKDVHLPAEQVPLWFARTLRDAMALSATGSFAPMRELFGANLENLLASRHRDPTTKDVEHVLEGFSLLEAHPDVVPAFERAKSAGLTIALVTNAGAQTTRELVSRNRLGSLVDAVWSVDEVRLFKPNLAVYLKAAESLALPADRSALVAAHAWDCLGASAAGLTTGWVRRQEKRFPRAMGAPDVRGDSLVEVVEALLRLPPY